MASRRGLLAAGVSLPIGVGAGYVLFEDEISCRLSNHYDILKLETVPESVATAPEAVLVSDEQFGDDAHAAVRKAANRTGVYRVCHSFEGEPSDVERLFGEIKSAWERNDVETARDRTYLQYRFDYYGIAIGILDRIPVASIPTEE